DSDGICGMAFADLVENRRGIGFARRREHAVQYDVDVRLRAQGTGKRLPSARWFRLYGPAHLQKSGVEFSLAEEKIGVAPRDFGGKRISTFRMNKSIAGSRNIPFGFVGGS